MTRQTKILILGGVFGGFAIVVGAFGAHALKNILHENGRSETFELAVRYQFYHALVLLIMGSLYEKLNPGKLWWAAIFITVGIGFFCGSLYVLSFSGNTFWGAVTPIGGLFLIAGWLTFTLAIKKQIRS